MDFYKHEFSVWLYLFSMLLSLVANWELVAVMLMFLLVLILLLRKECWRSLFCYFVGDLWCGACLWPLSMSLITVIVLYDTPNLRFKKPLTIGQRSMWFLFLSIFAYSKCSGEKRRENHVYSLIKNKIIALFQTRLVT